MKIYFKINEFIIRCVQSFCSVKLYFKYEELKNIIKNQNKEQKDKEAENNIKLQLLNINDVIKCLLEYKEKCENLEKDSKNKFEEQKELVINYLYYYS